MYWAAALWCWIDGGLGSHHVWIFRLFCLCVCLLFASVVVCSRAVCFWFKLMLTSCFVKNLPWHAGLPVVWLLWRPRPLQLLTDHLQRLHPLLFSEYHAEERAVVLARGAAVKQRRTGRRMLYLLATAKLMLKRKWFKPGCWSPFNPC